MDTRTAPPDLNDVAERLLTLEHWAGDVSAYLAASHGQPSPRPAAAPAPAQRPAEPRPAPAPVGLRPGPARARISVEDLLGGRVLGWAGGIAVLLGVAFFVAIAVNRGWIDEATRIALAFIASLGLLAAGVWLYERRGKTQAATATTGAAIAALFVTLTAGRTLYELYPAAAGLAGALLVGALATVLAIRWDAETIGGLGIVGALLAPVLVQAGAGGESLAYLAIALSSAVGVLVWRRWEWLGITALAVTAPQLIAWALDGPPAGALVVVPIVFWALWALAALGHELRVPAAALRPSSSLVLTGGALAAALAADWGLHDLGQTGLADATVAGLAGLNIACGIVALRARRIAHEIGLLLIAAGIVLGDVAFGAAASGPLLAIGWAGSALALAGLARVAPHRDLGVLRVGLAGQLALSLVHTLASDAPPAALNAPGALTSGSVRGRRSQPRSVLLRAPGRLGGRRPRRPGRRGDGSAGLRRRSGPRRGRAPPGLGGAGTRAGQGRRAHRRRPRRRGRGRLPGAGRGSSAGLRVAAGRAGRGRGGPGTSGAGPRRPRRGLPGLRPAGGPAPGPRRALPPGRRRRGARVPGIRNDVDLFASGGVPAAAGLEGLGAEQQGQVALSAFWGLTGLGALVAGLVRDRREARLAGFGLLVLTLVKVFAFDLTALDSVYRVLSLVALGLLLLIGAFAYQRMRPGGGEPPPGDSPPATAS